MLPASVYACRQCMLRMGALNQLRVRCILIAICWIDRTICLLSTCCVELAVFRIAISSLRQLTVCVELTDSEDLSTHLLAVVVS